MSIDLAIIQLKVELSEDVKIRVDHVLEILDSLDEGTFAILPELWTIGAFNYAPITEEVFEVQEAIATKLINKVLERKIYLHFGSMPKRDSKSHSTFNQSKIFNPDGGQILKYSKIHLFGGPEGERKDFSSGDQVETVMIGEMMFGCAICYDLRFPELFRTLLAKGAETLIVSASWPSARISHWRTLLSARAIENQSYVVGCNAVGNQRGVQLGGNSMVINPSGEIIAELGVEPGVLRIHLDSNLVSENRQSFNAVHEYLNP
jgi:predicted amidohydrolase